jgi:hypothetical protein
MVLDIQTVSRAIAPGTVCSGSVVHFNVAAPKIPAMITQVRKKVLIGKPSLARISHTGE